MTTGQFTQIAEVIGIIERGDLQAEASQQMQALLQRLADISGPKGKAKVRVVARYRRDDGRLNWRFEIVRQSVP